MKITVLDTNTVTRGDISLDPIAKLGEVSFFDMLSEDGIIDAAYDSQVIVCNKSKITRRVLESCPKLGLVTLFATGYNNIDLAAATECGVVVANVPGYSTDSVAQHTFSLILELSGNLSKYNSSVRAGDWASCDRFCYFSYPLHELSGKTLGIYGLGTIGRKVAEIGLAFGMKVIACTRTPRECRGVELVSMRELFERSDYLTFHCPLNAETENLVSEKTLSLMKPTAFLINTARGGVVNEQALHSALVSGKIAGAAVDVLDVEPMVKDHIYLSTPNLIITPHIAWATDEARTRLISRVAENIQAFKNGFPENQVNK